MKYIKKITIILIIFLYSQSAFACKFIPREYVDIYKNSSNVFVGKFINISGDKVNFKNLKTYKGESLKTFSVLKGNTSCDFQNSSFLKNSIWLIFSRTDESKQLHFSLISRSRPFKTMVEVVDFMDKEVFKKKSKIENNQITNQQRIEKRNKSSKINSIRHRPKQPKKFKGPTSRPPTKAEVAAIIKKQKQAQENHDGFFYRIKQFFLSLFN